MRRQGHADAGFGMQAVAEHIVRTADILQDAARQVVGQILAIDADLQDGELIAAEPADHVAGAQTALQARSDALQKAVADEVAVAGR